MPIPVPEGYDLTNPDIYAEHVPLDEFAWLRRSAPVFWNEQTAGTRASTTAGYGCSRVTPT